MAFTPDQQYLIDTKTIGNSEQCCLALGGDVIDPGEGDMLCSFETYEFPLPLACQTLGPVAEEEPSVEDQGPGFLSQFGGWFGENVGGLSDSFVNIWGALNPLETASLPPVDGGGGGYTPPVDEGNNKKQIWLIVGFVLVLVATVYFLRRNK